jgi:hypothetical protein
MKLSLENLTHGMKWWQQSTWASDYLNLEYYTIYEDRNGGLTKGWLGLTVNRLARWRAIRSKKPPNSKEQIFALLSGILRELENQYQRILNLSKREPSVTHVSWEDIDPLYTTGDIKNGSPVFASKLSHFIFPKVFIVMDRSGTETSPYDYYWQGMVNEWRSFKDKHVAIDALKKQIEKNSSRPVHPEYPFQTKIIELCHIGHKWRYVCR